MTTIPPGLTLCDLLDAIEHSPVGITQGRAGDNRYAAALGTLRHDIGAELLGVSVGRLRQSYAVAHLITLADADFEALRSMAATRAEYIEHAHRLPTRRQAVAA